MAVTVTLTGDGLAFEAESNLMQAAQIIGFLNNNNAQDTLVSAPSTGYAQQPVALGFAEKKLSPREYLQQKAPKTNPQKILVLGQFIAERDQTESFSVVDLKSIFVKAGEPTPRNLGRDLKETVRAGYITADEAQSDQYVVTNTGLEQLQAGFNGAERPARRVSRSRSPAKHDKVPAQLRQEIANLEIADVVDGLPHFHTLPQKTDKILWIIASTRLQDIKMVTAKEIEHIASNLSDNIPAHQVSAYMKTSLKKGYVSRTADGYRLLHDGMQYIKTQNAAETDV